MQLQNAAQSFCEYSLHIRGYSPTTIKRYKYVLRSFARYCTIVSLSDITSDSIRRLFFYGRTERNWSTNTYHVFYKSLSVFLQWCQKQGYIVTNPIIGIEKPSIEKKLPPKLTRQEALRLLEIIDNYPYDNSFLRYRNHAIFALFIFAGLRLNELLKLRYSDVDVLNLVVFIRQGKGNKDRIVPISSGLVQSLEKYLIERKKTSKTCPEFFASSIRNIGFTTSGMKLLVLNIRQASGIKFTVHKLRHTFATLMLEGGCDIYSLSKIMGHSDIKTTTIYLAASAEHLRSQIGKHPLNELITN
jgi:site-specific recombinase XerD